VTSQLPKARQKMVAEMLDALIVQAQQETDSQETGFLARVESGGTSRTPST